MRWAYWPTMDLGVWDTAVDGVEVVSGGTAVGRTVRPASVLFVSSGWSAKSLLLKELVMATIAPLACTNVYTVCPVIYKDYSILGLPLLNKLSSAKNESSPTKSLQTLSKKPKHSIE